MKGAGGGPTRPRRMEVHSVRDLGPCFGLLLCEAFRYVEEETDQHHEADKGGDTKCNRPKNAPFVGTEPGTKPCPVSSSRQDVPAADQDVDRQHGQSREPQVLDDTENEDGHAS